MNKNKCFIYISNIIYFVILILFEFKYCDKTYFINYNACKVFDDTN